MRFSPVIPSSAGLQVRCLLSRRIASHEDERPTFVGAVRLAIVKGSSSAPSCGRVSAKRAWQVERSRPSPEEFYQHSVFRGSKLDVYRRRSFVSVLEKHPLRSGPSFQRDGVPASGVQHQRLPDGLGGAMGSTRRATSAAAVVAYMISIGAAKLRRGCMEHSGDLKPSSPVRAPRPQPPLPVAGGASRPLPCGSCQCRRTSILRTLLTLGERLCNQGSR